VEVGEVTGDGKGMASADGLLEVIVLSVDDARAAERGGAGRLEIVRDLDREGLTPAFDLVARIVAAVSIPVRVMLRAREPFDGHAEGDLGALADAAVRFSTLGVDGFVTGFLKGGAVDLNALGRVLAGVPGSRVTFHRAFEAAADAGAAVESLKLVSLVDRVLATGGTGAWPGRAERLERLARQARPRIIPVAAAGVDEAGIKYLRDRTSLREFHVGRAARDEARVDRPVSAARVAALARAVAGLA